MRTAATSAYLWGPTGLYLALGVLYSLCTPLWEAPDEPSHYLCVRRLADGARFIYPRIPGSPDAPDAKRQRFSLYQEIQPPLYRVLAAPALKALCARALPIGPELTYPDVQPDLAKQANQFVHARTSVWRIRPDEVRGHLFRLMHLFPGVLTVWLVYRVARAAQPEAPETALLAAAFVALLPQFDFITGAINNDGHAALAGTAALLAMVKALRAPAMDSASIRRQALALGAIAAACMLVKVNLIFLYPLALGVVIRQARRHGFLGIAVSIGWFVLPTVALAAVVFALAPARVTPLLNLTLTRLFYVADFRLEPAYLGERLLALYQSFWARFGWMRIRVGSWMYWTWGMLAVASVAGWAVRVRRGVGRDANRPAVLLLAAAFAILLLGTFKNTLAMHQAQGRFLFPAIGAIAVLFAAGILGPLREAHRLPAACAVTGLLLFLNLAALAGYLIPASYP